MYFLLINGEQRGPLEEAEVRTMVAAGALDQGTLVWHAGLSDWQPVGEIFPVEKRGELLPLPPVPPRTPSNSRSQAKASVARSNPMQTVGGVVALLLGVLGIFNVGGCVNAERKLDSFTRGKNPNVVPRLFLDTVRGIQQDDPLRAISSIFDQKAELEKEVEESRSGAWLCLIGAAVAAGVSVAAGAASRARRRC